MVAPPLSPRYQSFASRGLPEGEAAALARGISSIEHSEHSCAGLGYRAPPPASVSCRFSRLLSARSATPDPVPRAQLAPGGAIADGSIDCTDIAEIGVRPHRISTSGDGLSGTHEDSSQRYDCEVRRYQMLLGPVDDGAHRE